jgi:hypothetical protein
MVALLVLAAIGVVARLALFNVPPGCLDTESLDPGCAVHRFNALEYQSFSGNWLSAVGVVAAYVPAIAGVILGIAVIAKELDQRTAVLAWSVGPSRRIWLLQRVGPLVALLVLVGVGCAQLIVVLMHVRSPGEIQLEFAYISYLGFGPAALAVSAFGLTTFVGAMLGRLLPTLLAAAAFVIFAALIVTQGNDRLMANDSLVVDAMHTGGGEYIEALLRTPDGRMISWNDAFPEFADPDTGEARPGMTQMSRYVPIEIYPQVAARFALFHFVIGLVSLTLAFAVVERRSP